MNNLILFLCTGNYYRSRFAELWFNHQAKDQQVAWRAESRGLAIELGGGNIGPISLDTLIALAERDIHPPAALRYPLQVTEPDFAEAQRVIALHHAEHWPMMLRRYPAWAERIEYWHVPDLGLMSPPEALRQIENQVGELIQQLT